MGSPSVRNPLLADYMPTPPVAKPVVLVSLLGDDYDDTGRAESSDECVSEPSVAVDATTSSHPPPSAAASPDSASVEDVTEDMLGTADVRTLPCQPPELVTLDSVVKYTVDRKLGEGVFGVVFRATTKDTGTRVALKEFKITGRGSKSRVPRTLWKEMRALSAVTHPNVVRAIEVVAGKAGVAGTGENALASDSAFLVMEYVEYELARLMRHNGPLPVASVKSVMSDLLRGLAALQAANVLHRDIKPTNLLVSASGVVKIADFGLARSVEGNSEGKVESRRKVVTLYYRSPELLMGATSHGPAVDVWSAGCIMAELVSGSVLLAGESEDDQVARMFRLFGRASDRIWPGFSELPRAQGLRRSGALARFEASDAYKYDNLRLQLNPTADLAHVPFPPRTARSFECLSDAGFDLLGSMLKYNPDPAVRVSAAAALAHPWFAEGPAPVALDGKAILTRGFERAQAQVDARAAAKAAAKAAAEAKAAAAKVAAEAKAAAAKAAADVKRESASREAASRSAARAASASKAPAASAVLQPATLFADGAFGQGAKRKRDSEVGPADADDDALERASKRFAGLDDIATVGGLFGAGAASAPPTGFSLQARRPVGAAFWN